MPDSYHYWGGRRAIAPEDMRVMAVDARPGKTARDKKSGAHTKRFKNRAADPKRRKEGK